MSNNGSGLSNFYPDIAFPFPIRYFAPKNNYDYAKIGFLSAQEKTSRKHSCLAKNDEKFCQKFWKFFSDGERCCFLDG